MRRVVLRPGAESSATGMSLTALTERVHSDGAIPPGRKYFLLMLLGLEMLLGNPRIEQTIPSLSEGAGSAEAHTCKQLQVVDIQFLGATTCDVLNASNVFDTA